MSFAKGIVEAVRTEFKNNKLDFILKYGFIIFFLIQVINIAYVNLNNDIVHLGFDAAPIYTNAIEIWEQRTLNPQTVRRNFSNLHLDTSMPFAALMYGITGNIFLAYGIVNLTIAIMIAVMLVFLVKMSLHEISSKEMVLPIAVALAILFSPFINSDFNVANPLSDFYSLLFASAAFWGFRVLTGLLCIASFILLYSNQRTTGLSITIVASSAIMFFICSVSTGYYALITFIVPVIIFMGYKLLMGDISIREVVRNKALYLVLLWIGLTFVGRHIAYVEFDFEPRDTATLVGASLFFDNLQGIYLGLLILLGAMQSGLTPALSEDGMVLLSNMFISHALLASFILMLYAAIKKKIILSDTSMIFVLMFFSNLAMFVLTHLRYGSPFFEARYLIVLVLCLVVLFPVFISSVEWGRYVHLRKFLLLCLLAALLISNRFSFRKYLDTTIADHIMIAQELSAFEAGLVYVGAYDDWGILTSNLRVIDTNRIYHGISIYAGRAIKVGGWVGGYLHLLERGSHNGETILLLSEQEFNSLSPFLRDRFVMQQVIPDVGLNIYMATRNYIHMIEEYFIRTILREGTGVLFTTEYGTVSFLEAVHSVGFQGDFKQIRTGTGTFTENGLRSGGAGGTLMYGPYLWLPSGSYNATVQLSLDSYTSDELGVLDVVTHFGEEVFYRILFNTVDFLDGAATFTLPFVLSENAYNVEVRVKVSEGTIVYIREVNLSTYE
ncbi:MAG: hypothetical protein FWB80_00500 [Defluviitaleaceae bacterium]|nr:hypothetical protein [Defluviitaleaceae bacterium]